MEMNPTSASSWAVWLRRRLNRLVPEENRPRRIAIVGVGNELRGDDGAGMFIARTLQARLKGAAGSGRVLILQGGNAPENCAGQLRNFAPDLVILIDAAMFDEPAGTIRMIPSGTIDGMSASTHALPLSMLARYLTLELNCTVRVLGIQARSTEVGEDLGEEVLRAAYEVVAGISDLVLT